MKIFLTGGAGFIGSHIADRLIADGHEVTIYDNFSTGLWENVDRQKFLIEKGDIRNFSWLVERMAHHDLVIHQAAALEITSAISRPKHDADINILGSLNVLKAMKECGIRDGIFASSACVYGQKDSSFSISENSSLNPNWEYGVGKLAVEKYCDIIASSEGMRIASLRYSIVYGEREWYGRALTVFIKRALNNLPIVVFGNGEVIRDFIHVSDVADACSRIIEQRFPHIVRGTHAPYNISSGFPVKINHLARIISRLIGVEVIYEDLKEGEISSIVTNRIRIPRELKHMLLDNYRAREDLGWAPRTFFLDGLREEIEWAKAHPERWQIDNFERV